MEIRFDYNTPELKAVAPEKDDTLEPMILKKSSEVADYLRKMWEGIEIYESFYALYLNRANKVIGWYKVSQGGITGTVADPRLVMKKAIETLATGLVISHNHPSGNIRPSRADEQLTQRLKEGANFFDITLLDHIIITTDGYYSFTDEGML